MNATDELRRMLDERGVEYETNDAQVSDTEWYYVTKLRDGYSDRWVYEEPPDCDLLVSYQYDLGAEDAVEATLGRGTCRIEHVKSGAMYDVWRCSACGYEYAESIAEEPVAQNFCPSCGREVVSE